MKHLFWILAGAALVQCSTQDDPRCRPCEVGACPEPLQCALTSSTAGVCVAAGRTADSCATGTVDGGMTDAGATDSGAIDVGPQDSGPPDLGLDARCLTSTAVEVTWVYSQATSLCFTQGEITAAQFETCLDSNCTAFPNYRTFDNVFPECNLISGTYDQHPMNCVTAEGGTDFCGLLSGRLPSPAEWTAEASAGGTRMYPWGDEPPDCTRAAMDDGSVNGCTMGVLQVACTLPAGNSISGVCDMAGNVAELTSMINGSQVVVMGGNLNSNAGGLRSDAESNAPVRGTYGLIGFRCVKDPI